MSLKTYTSLMLTKIFKYFNSLPADILSFLVAQYVKLSLNTGIWKHFKNISAYLTSPVCNINTHLALYQCTDIQVIVETGAVKCTDIFNLNRLPEKGCLQCQHSAQNNENKTYGSPNCTLWLKFKYQFNHDSGNIYVSSLQHQSSEI